MATTLSGFDRMHATTSYMLSLFTHTLATRTCKGSDGHPLRPDHLSAEMVTECDSVVESLVKAFLDPGMSYDKFCMDRDLPDKCDS